MSWVAVGITAGTMIIGGVQADEQQRAQAKHNRAAAEHNRYSNWTGRTMEQKFGAPSVMGGALQGGMAGFGMSRGFAGGGQPISGGTGGAGTPSMKSSPYTSGQSVGTFSDQPSLYGNIYGRSNR